MSAPIKMVSGGAKSHNLLWLGRLSVICLAMLSILLAVHGQNSSCPEECTCPRPEMVDCTQKKLATIPGNIGRYVTKLHLKDNKLTRIPDGSFARNIYVKHLMLSNNKLTDDGINATSFKGLVSLHKLGLSRNKLTTVPFFGQQLGNLSRLLLSNNKITSIPSGVFDNLYHLRMLDLGNNKIRDIRTGTFGQLKNLFRLVLSNNKITQIDPGSFDNLTALSSINLGKNRLESISQDVFSRLGKLSSLDLSNNQLQRVHSRAFQNLNKLGILNLDHNQISQIDDNAFSGLNKLHRLELGWNQIDKLSTDWLYELPLLRTLKVSHNLINYTDSTLWKYCEFLEILDISFNGIANVKPGSFADLQNLLELSLSNNQLSDVERDTFLGLTRLQALDLSANALLWTGERPNPFNNLSSLIQLNLSTNHIKTVTNQLFASLQTLEYLDLSGNAISSIQNNAFSMIYGLRELSLNSEALACNCDLKWFPVWMRQFGQKFSIDAKCDMPEYIKGKNILDVDYKNITCDSELTGEGSSPVIIIHPESSMAVLGQNVSLACTATLNTFNEDLPYTVNWLKDGQGSTYSEFQSLQDSPNPSVQVFKHKSSNNSTELTTFLHLTNVTESTQGKFQCSISNNFGRQVSQEAQVKVFTRDECSKPMFKEHPKSTYSWIRGFVTMQCVAVFTGDSPYTFTWYKDGKGPLKPRASHETSGPVIEVIEIDREVGYMRKITSTLHITDAQWDDEGLYQCAVTNNYGQLFSKEALFYILADDDPYDVPFIVTHPKPAVAMVTQNITLRCDAVYTPNPDHEYYFLNWLKDGQALYTHREMLAQLETDNFQIEWIVHERNPDPDEKYVQELTTLLHLKNIQPEDHGNYQCIVTNQVEQEVSDKAEVRVYGESIQPVLIKHPQSTVGMRGTNVTLTCITAFSGDGPYVANWLKGAVALYTSEEWLDALDSPNPRVRVIDRLSTPTEEWLDALDSPNPRVRVIDEQIGAMRQITNILYLTNIHERDEGTYQCSISNNFGRKISYEAVVTVQAFPKFTSRPQDNTVTSGQNVKLQCGAKGYPTPKVYWMKDDKRVFPADREMRFIDMPYKDDFFIVSVKRRDEGVYSCVASNNVGQVVAKAKLTVT
ncbi:uncharacterized protein [Amphiura filiformis]|uniref:uncharacterized protein n=1 Tax=Amphiura filiformis TaxID=82378 RepID=UPI003B224A7C